MGYADPEKQRAYMRKWMAERRASYLAGMVCIDCGATERLEIDRRDPSQKVSHAIWSWRQERLLEEFAKCDIRCHACHKARHAGPAHGINAYKRKGCRCEICRAAKRAEGERYAERKRRAAEQMAA